MLGKKKFTWIIILVVLLIVARLLLPYFVEKYVNKTLDDIPGYTGHVEDVDLALYRGAYNIDGLVLEKEESPYSEPILYIAETDISLEWEALFDGRIVSEISLTAPHLNIYFTPAPEPAEEEKADVEDWSEALADLVPIEINELEISGGRIDFVQPGEKWDLFLEHIELNATNLSNAINTSGTLPSSLTASAVSVGGGSVSITGRMDLMQKVPDMDINFKLQNADVTAINDFIRSVASVDFASGTFELYSEFAVADGYLEGYLKPMFIDTKILGRQDTGFLENLWEGFVGLLKFLFKNHSTETLATKAPLRGDLNNLDTGVFATIINIFENAWINAFATDVDENINYEDARNKNAEEQEEEDEDDGLF